MGDWSYRNKYLNFKRIVYSIVFVLSFRDWFFCAMKVVTGGMCYLTIGTQIYLEIVPILFYLATETPPLIFFPYWNTNISGYCSHYNLSSNWNSSLDVIFFPIWTQTYLNIVPILFFLPIETPPLMGFFPIGTPTYLDIVPILFFLPVKTPPLMCFFFLLEHQHIWILFPLFSFFLLKSTLNVFLKKEQRGNNIHICLSSLGKKTH